jgi:thymidylate kinase
MENHRFNFESWGEFFKDLNANGIQVCIWKKTKLIHESLSGLYDVDLCLIEDPQNKISEVLTQTGFYQLFSNVYKQIEIQHWYIYSPQMCKNLHIHLYVKLCTGVGHVKNYMLPVNFTFKKNISTHKIYKQIPVVNFQLTQQLAETRKIIKAQSLLNFYYNIKKRGIYLLEQKNDENGHQNEYLDEIGEKLKIKNDGALETKLKICKQLKIKKRHSNTLVYCKLIATKLKIIPKKHSQETFPHFIAVIGTDGVGKSTIVNMLKTRYQKSLQFKITSFGKVTSATFKKRKNYSAASNIESQKQYLRALLVGFLRYLKYTAANLKLSLGWILVSDRIPSKIVGMMDSPRLQKRNNSSLVYKLIQKCEMYFYSACPTPGIVFKLEASVDSCINRNQKRNKVNKETANEIRKRHKEFANYIPIGKRIYTINAEQTTEQVFNDITTILEKYLRKNKS